MVIIMMSQRKEFISSTTTMALRFHSSGDAILSYCTVFSMYITLWNMERQSDTLLLILYYSDFFYFAQYVCVKLSQSWQEFESEASSEGIDSIEEEISLTESLPFFTTPISLLPFHVVFKMGLDRGCFYQFVCFLRLFSLYQDGRIHWEQRVRQGHIDTDQMGRSISRTARVSSKPTMECQCNCRSRRTLCKDS